MRFAYNPLINNLDLVGITSVEDDPNPTLGGDLNVNGYSIISLNNGDIRLSPNGSGRVILDGLEYPATDGSNGQAIVTDGSGNLSFQTVGSGGDVTGPASSISDDIATFNGTTGKIIKDGGKKITDLLLAANNLSDLTNTTTARSNLGLGTIATQNTPLGATVGGTSQTTYATGDILVATATNTLGKTSIPTTTAELNFGSPFIYNGTTAAYYDQLKDILLQDDFISLQATGCLGWANSTSGTGRVQQNVAGLISNPGIWTMDNNGGTGAASIQLSTAGVLLGGGRVVMNFWVYLSALSTLSDTYIFRCGLGDANLGTDHTDGVYFQYTNDGSGTGENSPNWAIKTASNNSRTFQASNTSVVASTTSFTRLSIDINAAASSAAFYVNGVQLNVSPLSTNIPTGTGRECGPRYNFSKTSGTGTVIIATDLFSYWQHLTNPRSS